MDQRLLHKISCLCVQMDKDPLLIMEIPERSALMISVALGDARTLDRRGLKISLAEAVAKLTRAERAICRTIQDEIWSLARGGSPPPIKEALARFAKPDPAPQSFHAAETAIGA